MKNFFIFISIIMLSASLAYASDSEGGIPSLPSAFEAEHGDEAEDESNKSFWQKFKEFIGFSSGKKLSSENPSLEKPHLETFVDNNPSLPVYDETIEEENKKATTTDDTIAGDESFPDITLPFERTEDGPTNINLPESSNEDMSNPSENISTENISIDNSKQAAPALQMSPDITHDTNEKSEQEIVVPQLPIQAEEATSLEEKVDLPALPGGVIEAEKSSAALQESTLQLPDYDENTSTKEESANHKLKDKAEDETEDSVTIADEVDPSKASFQNEEDDKRKSESNQAVTSTTLPVLNDKLPSEPPQGETMPSSPIILEEEKKNNDVNAASVNNTPGAALENKPDGGDIAPESADKAILLPSEIQTHENALPVPDYANSANPADSEDQAVLKYKQEFDSRKDVLQVPKISEEELSAKTQNSSNDNAADPLDKDQLEFIDNEAQVLILPNDDVVLGVLTDEAELEQMDFKSYVDIFWSSYNELKSRPQRVKIEHYIDNYRGSHN